MPDEARRVNPSRARHDDGRSATVATGRRIAPPPSIAAMSPNDPSPWQPPAGDRHTTSAATRSPVGAASAAGVAARRAGRGLRDATGLSRSRVRHATRARRRRQATTPGVTDRRCVDDRRSGDRRRRLLPAVADDRRYDDQRLRRGPRRRGPRRWRDLLRPRPVGHGDHHAGGQADPADRHHRHRRRRRCACSSAPPSSPTTATSPTSRSSTPRSAPAWSSSCSAHSSPWPGRSWPAPNAASGERGTVVIVATSNVA